MVIINKLIIIVCYCVLWCNVRRKNSMCSVSTFVVGEAKQGRADAHNTLYTYPMEAKKGGCT